MAMYATPTVQCNELREDDCSALIYEIISCNVTQAPAILRQVHSWPLDISLPSSIRSKTNALWTLIFGAGNVDGSRRRRYRSAIRVECMDAVLGGILTGYLCGYSQHELTCMRGTGPSSIAMQEHVRMCFATLEMTLSRIAEKDFEYHQDYFHGMTSYLERAYLVWKRLWNARDLVLGVFAGLDRAIAAIAKYEVEILTAFTSPPTTGIFGDHAGLSVLQYIWSHAKDLAPRGEAIIVWKNAMESSEHQTSPVMHRKHSALEAPLSARITRAFMRDLKDKRCSEAHRFAVIHRLRLARLYSRGNISPQSDYNLFRATLSLARRLKCLGSEIRWQATMPMVAFINQYVVRSWGNHDRSDPKISEEDLFWIVEVISTPLLGLMLPQNNQKADLTRVIDDCRRTMLVCIDKLENKRHTLLGYLSEEARASLRFMVGSPWGYIMKKMKGTVKDMGGRLAWQEAFDAYRRLGRSLALQGFPCPLTNVPGSVLPRRDPNVVMPYKQCHWVCCVDALMKPMHPLKACTGCFEVYYCGASCQKEDWSNGDHKHSCSRTRYRQNKLAVCQGQEEK